MAMPLTWVQEQISLKAFLQGLGVCCVLLVLLLGYTAFKGHKILEDAESRLASESIPLGEAVLPNAIPEASPVLDLSSSSPSIPSPASVSRDHGDGHGDGHGNGPEESTEENHGESHGDPHEVIRTSGTTSPAALSPAPLDGVYESLSGGRILPVVSPDGRKPFDVYKKPFPVVQTPYVALVVYGYGLSERLSGLALSFPPEVTFLMSPYAGHAKKWQAEARRAGHELWLHVPLQTAEYPLDDYGVYTVLAEGGLKENKDKLDSAMSSIAGYAGIAALTDGAFAAKPTILEDLMGYALKRGVGYFELNPQGGSLIAGIAANRKAPFLENDFLIENTSLKSIERQARERGFAIATVELNTRTADSLEVWLDTLPQKGITLVPLSAIWDKNKSE